MDKTHTACFTGHRQIPPSALKPLVRQMKLRMFDLYQQGTRVFITGGAMGFDTLAALTVLKMKEKYPDVELLIAIPFRNQTERWSQADKETYEQIKAQADEVIVVNELYTGNDCYHERNKLMVDRSSAVIAYCNRRNSGAGFTVNYAEQNGVPVFNLADTLNG